MYDLILEDKVTKKFKKLLKKNKKHLIIINKKILEIRKKPNPYKPLRGDLHGARRVKIDKHFVLIYEFDEKLKLIKILDFDHHDNIYEKE